MAGIYIHIPFCKKVCSYCDFYKTSVLNLIPEFISAVKKEIEIKKDFLKNEMIETIYFGGGTPSLLSYSQLMEITNQIDKVYNVSNECEITMEANPDDLSEEYLKSIIQYTPVNRLSIGIQSFNDDHLRLLQRRHNSLQSISCINKAVKYGFSNISIDIIYGIPGTDLTIWSEEIQNVFDLDVQHISAYCLTIEKGTLLYRNAEKGYIIELPEEDIKYQYSALCELAKNYKYQHYEISNFAKEGYISKHNSNYWKEKKYLGFGPSAHSYTFTTRLWNDSNLRNYILQISNNSLATNSEELDLITQYNEYIMISLRTMWGIDALKIKMNLGEKLYRSFITSVNRYVKTGQIKRNGDQYIINEEDWMIADYLISDLLIV